MLFKTVDPRLLWAFDDEKFGRDGADKKANRLDTVIDPVLTTTTNLQSRWACVQIDLERLDAREMH